MEKEIFEGLREAVLTYDPQAATTLTEKAVDAGLSPLKIMDALTEAIREVGEGYAQGDLFLPDLVAAAETLQAATPIVEEAMEKGGQTREVLGTVVIGTVFGDIHTIGKTMVSGLLRAEGFEVYDLGINVPAQDFVAAIKKHDADILAMSALLTTTAPQAGKVIESLQEAGLRDRVKVMVGGGALSEPFALGMGADGYAPSAPGAVTLAKRLLDVSGR